MVTQVMAILLRQRLRLPQIINLPHCLTKLKIKILLYLLKPTM